MADQQWCHAGDFLGLANLWYTRKISSDKMDHALYFENWQVQEVEI